MIRSASSPEGDAKQTAGQMIEFRHPAYAAYFYYVGGHDIRSKELGEFFGLICSESDPECAPNAHEAAFPKNVLTPIQAREGDSPFVLITAALQVTGDPKVTISHEALHAQYFMNERVQEIVKDYYYKVLTPEERAQFEAKWSPFYDFKNNEFVKLNEFFSYTVELNGEKTKRNGLKTDTNHKQAILDRVKAEAGIELFQWPAS